MTRKIMDVDKKLAILSSPIIKKMTSIYKYAFIEVTILVIITFSQTIYKKLMYGVWEQHGLILENSMGLTAHVITAVIFIVLFLAQVMFGVFQARYQSFAKMHIRLGQLLIAFTGIFLIMAAWAVVARKFNSTSIELLFYMDILFIAMFFVRGLIAIKQKKYSVHIDSMLGAFMISARSALFRFAFISTVFLYGSTPLKVGELAVLVNIFLYFNLFIFYYLANRWKENKNIVIFQLLFSTIYLISVILINKPTAHLFFNAGL